MLLALPSVAAVAGEDPKAARLFDKAQAAFARGDCSAAAKLFEKVATKTAASEPLAEQAQFMEAESYLKAEKLPKAYRNFERLLMDFPRTSRFEEVLNREYGIGDRMCTGYTRRVMLIFPAGTGEFGVEVLEKVIDHAPHGKLADQARMRIADYYLGKAKQDRTAFGDARTQYDLLLKTYPDSKLAPEARLRRAEAAEKSVSGARYNAGDMEVAVAELKNAKAADKGRETEGKIDAALAEIREKQIESDYETAKYYLKVGQPTAAELCLRAVVEKAPDSRYARYAKAALAELEKPGAEKP